MKLCDLIHERGYDFNIWAYARIDTVKGQYLDTLKKAGKSVNDVPEALTNALTRDYSDLMKAMNKKGK